VRTGPTSLKKDSMVSQIFSDRVWCCMGKYRGVIAVNQDLSIRRSRTGQQIE